MVCRIAGLVAGIKACIELADIIESAIHDGVCRARVEQSEKPGNFPVHRRRIGGLNAIGHVKIVASYLHRPQPHLMKKSRCACLLRALSVCLHCHIFA